MRLVYKDREPPTSAGALMAESNACVIDAILIRDQYLSMWQVVQALRHSGFTKLEISDAIKRYVDGV